MMLKALIDRFAGEFGRTVNDTKYVFGWEPRLDVGVAVEREGAETRSYVQVWVPHPGESAAIPANAVAYAATEGRHSNTYSLPGLRKGMPALRIKVENMLQLEEVVQFIRGLPPIRSSS